MAKQKILERLAALENEHKELRKILNSLQQTKLTPEQRLLQIIEGTVQHFDDKYPKSVFWMKEGLAYFELDVKNNFLSCRTDTVWDVFYNEYSMNYDQVQSLIKNVMEERFKIRDVTPYHD